MPFCSSCGANIPSGFGFCNSCGLPVSPGPTPSAVAAGQPARAAEHTFFQQNDVLITNVRFVKGSETFAMSGVTSVRSHTESPSKTGPILLIIFGAIVGLVLMQSSLPAAFIGAVMVGLGILWYRSIKNIYHVFLVTSSGERDAVSSFDVNYIGGIVAAVSQAIIHRG